MTHRLKFISFQLMYLGITRTLTACPVCWTVRVLAITRYKFGNLLILSMPYGYWRKNMGFDIPHMTNFAKRILKGFLIFPMGRVRMALNGQLMSNNRSTLKLPFN